MIKIDLDQTDKNVCYDHSLSRINYEFDRFNLSLEQRISMILIGTLGQTVFKKFLTQSKIVFEYEFQAGKFDDLDFKVGKKIIEVKSSGFKDEYENLNLLYSQSQFIRGVHKKYNYCVLIFINGYDKKNKLIDLDECNSGIIAGYVPYMTIKNFKNKRQFFGDDYKVPLSKMQNITTLLALDFNSLDF